MEVTEDRYKLEVVHHTNPAVTIAQHTPIVYDESESLRKA
jgi:hypothetical protein